MRSAEWTGMRTIGNAAEKIAADHVFGRLPADVLRAKGFVQLDDDTDRTYLLPVVG